MQRKVSLLIATVTLLATGLFAAAVGDTGRASPSRSNGALVSLGRTALGKVLVDAHGRTLYLFEKDRRGMSACNGACVTYWPPLLSSAKPRPGRGVRASLLGLTRRTDGKRQVTYAGHPLYRFVSDRKAGQTTGEGLKDFGATWDVVGANGRGIDRDAPSPGNSGGYSGLYGSG